MKGCEKEWEETENDCAVILVIVVRKFTVWTDADEAGSKPPGWISEIKVPRLLLLHHIPHHRGGILLLTQKDGASEKAPRNRQRMESKRLSGGFAGIESCWTLRGFGVDRRHQGVTQSCKCVAFTKKIKWLLEKINDYACMGKRVCVICDSTWFPLF